jgi:hypothetical protein
MQFVVWAKYARRRAGRYEDKLLGNVEADSIEEARKLAETQRPEFKGRLAIGKPLQPHSTQGK